MLDSFARLCSVLIPGCQAGNPYLTIDVDTLANNLRLSAYTPEVLAIILVNAAITPDAF